VSRFAIAAWYTAFALVAGSCNLATQWVVSHAWPWPYAVLVSMVCGTGAGFACKYVLDRVFIFRFQPGSMLREALTVTKYGGTGVFTTALFWATELAFHALSEHPYARFAGAALGLAMGYTIKYQLDKRHVFRH
jgi:putative flippase GtrA